MLNSFNVINKVQKNFFTKYGYIVLTNQLTFKMKNELKRYIQDIEIDSLKLDSKYIHKFEYDNNNEKQLCRTEDIIKHNGMNKFLTNGFLSNLVSNLYEKPVLLYKEKINYKYPNTGVYKAHQDITAYPNSKNHITALINLCGTNELNGSIQFSPLCENNYVDNTILEHKNGVIFNQEQLNWSNSITSSFGDIILFNSYIPHRSSVNKSNLPRKALYVTYNDADEGDLRKEYYDMKKKQLKGDKISLINHYEGKIISDDTTSQKKYVIDYIINLYKTEGKTLYDKKITQLEHAFQTVEIAKQNDKNEKFHLCCFLHDIGHLLLKENNNNSDFLNKDLHHELIGYRFLNNFFDSSITKPILLHVEAKRYLCSINKKYYNSLSEASKTSFKLQGGYMSNDEITQFCKNTNYEYAVKLREIEDISKNTKLKNMNFDYIIYLLNKYII